MELTAQTKNEAISLLQSKANAWISANSARSKTSLAREVGCSEACIRRLLNDNVLPNTDNLLKLVSFFSDAKTPADLTSPELGSVGKLISYQMPFLAFEENREAVLWGSLSNQLNTQLKKIIFTKISAQSEVSFEEIKKDFGSFGFTEAMSLVEGKLLEVVENKFKVVAGFTHTFADAHSLKEILEIATKMYYKPQLKYNRSFLVAEGVSLKGYCEIMDVLGEAHEKIVKLKSEHPGNIPLIATGFMDTMTSESFFNEEGGDNE